MPSSAIKWGETWVISLRLKDICPLSGFTNPEMVLKKVVFPEPLGPMMPKISPSFTAREKPLRATTPSKWTVRFCAFNNGGTDVVD